MTRPILGIDARSVSVGLSSTQLVGPNPRRWGLLIGCPLTNRITISPKSAAVLDAGITLYPASNPLYLLYPHIGEAIREDVFAITVVGAMTIGIWDIFFA